MDELGKIHVGLDVHKAPAVSRPQRLSQGNFLQWPP
jgi:hypothetical protein